MRPELAEMATTSRIGPPHLEALRCGDHTFARAADQRAVTAQFAVVWLQEGECVLTDGRGRRHRLEAGDAFHRAPEIVHSVGFGAGTRILFAAVPAEGLALLRVLGAPALDDPVIRPGRQPDLARRWRMAVADLARARPKRLASLAGRVLELIVELHQRSAASDDAGMTTLMERAARHLGDASAQPLRQPALARSLGLSYRTFRRAFVAHAGLPPEAYRIRCRIAQAQELLRASALPIAAIAERLGYRDGADFARQFARVTGRSPRAYRRDPLLG
jgi:AraC-like DNA-binding protein